MLLCSPGQLYFVFGFLFAVLLILVATCAEITIVMCYFQVRGPFRPIYWSMVAAVKLVV